MHRHTPGTWAWNGKWRVCAFDAAGRIANMICDTANNAKSRTEENNANAALIAASPDLLAACKLLKSRLIIACGDADLMSDDDAEAIRIADAAICKAIQ